MNVSNCLYQMKILIIITNNLYVRNYLSTSAFSDIERTYPNTFYLCETSVNEIDSLRTRPGFIGSYTLDPVAYDQHIELLNVLMWRFRKRSSTFMFRFLILYWPKTSKFHHENPTKNPFRKVARYLKALKYPFLGNFIVSRISLPALKARIRVNAEIDAHLKRLRPDLVILPASAYDPIGTDLVTLSPQYGYQTLFLIDNWDNLSSKSVLWKKPDFLCVWGEQTRQHATAIHDMAPDSVFPVGTPRFETYYSNSKPSSPYPFRYVLFCGCSEPFDEITALHLLDAEISANQDFFGEMKVIYRPHPSRHKRFCDDLFRKENFSNVMLDRQIVSHYYQPDADFQPDLEYYPALLFNATVVVAPLTTMVIEALICGKPVVAIVYDDDVHFTSPHNTYKYFHHFKGIEAVHGLQFCHRKDNLGASLRSVVRGFEMIDRERIRKSVQYFLHHDGEPYSIRIKNVVDTIGHHRRLY